MSHAHQRTRRQRRLDPRQPLVFETRTLGPGSARAEARTVSAPADLGAGLVGIPEGAELSLDVQLEGVSEGVLVTATVAAPLAGQCARCLADFTSATTVAMQELFAYDLAPEDGYLLDGELLDLEPALRDAVVVELPLAPLCAEDCRGLCPECGVRLADAGAGHGHGVAEPAGPGSVSAGPGSVPARPGPVDWADDGAPDGTPVPGREKER